MDWIQAFTIIGSLGAFTFWHVTKLDSDIKLANARHDEQMKRIDRLYEMFIDLLKQKKE